MPRVKRLGGITILAAMSLGCVLASTGCTSEGGATGSAAARPVATPSAVRMPSGTPTPSSVLQYPLPLAAYQLTPLQNAEENYLGERLEQLCLGKLGFSFLPGLSGEAVAQGVRITDEFESRLYGVSDPVAARAYGYNLPAWVQGTGKPESAAELGTAELAALTGKGPAPAGRAVPRGGCLGQAERELQQAGISASAQQSGGSDPSTLASSAQLASFERAQSSPPVRAVFARWSACMRGYGDHYATPFTAAADPRWTRSATPSRLEIQTAEHDIGCKLRVNVLGVEFAVVSRYQDQAITARARAFAQAKKIIASEARGLRRLMASVPA
jgi:hypothetical protein